MGQSGSSNLPPYTSTEPQQQEGPTWWCKLLAKGCGVAAGLGAMIIGVINCITVSPICLVSAILLMMVGFLMITLEAPCCCPFLDFIQPLGRWSDSRPPFHKAALYAICAILPLALCFSLTKLLASAIIMGSAVLYGLMALGKKAERTEMSIRARGPGPGDTEMNTTLINNQEVQADHK